MKVKFKKLHPLAIPFTYSREDDACMDMYTLNYEDRSVLSGETAIIPTGIAVEVPHQHEGIVRGRSGLSSKGISIHLGTIDETYKGDISIIITNNSNTPFLVKAGMRLAQFTIKPVYHIELEEVENLSDSIRGCSGFGSSGIY